MASIFVGISASSIMSRILNRSSKIKETKENIRDAIIERDVDVPEDTPFSEYPDKIKQIMFNTDKIITIGATSASDYKFSARCQTITIEEELPFKKILIYGDETLGDYAAATKRISGSDIGTWSVKGQAKRCSYDQLYMSIDLQNMAMSAYNEYKSRIVDAKHLIVTYSDGSYKFAFLPVDFKIVDVTTNTQYKPPQSMYGTSYFRIQKAHIVTVPVRNGPTSTKSYRFIDENGGSFDQIANIVYSSIPLMCKHVQIWPNDPNVTLYDYGGCPIL